MPVFAQVLDPCCSSRMFWFDKQDKRAIFCDKRKENHVLCDGRTITISPDTIADFRKLPFSDNKFAIVVFDPPHLVNLGDKSWTIKKYGSLSKNTWQVDLSLGFNECWRVLRPLGTLIFKWSEEQISLKEVLKCFEEKPLFGHNTRKNTFWLCFLKDD